MTQIYANNFTTLVLGRRGENLARKVVFDIRDLESLYGTGATRGMNSSMYEGGTVTSGKGGPGFVAFRKAV